MPVLMVANKMAGPTVFFDEDTNTQVEWGGAGDEAGNDIQACPASITENHNFTKALRRGIFELVSEEVAEERFQLQKLSWDARMDADARAATEFIETPQRNDTLGIRCVGPSSSGRGICTEMVLIKDRDKGSKPPLCGKHAHLASQYIPLPDMSGKINSDGKVDTNWTRAITPDNA